MTLFLGCQCWYAFDDKTSFPGAGAILYVLYVYALVWFFFCFFFFEILKNYTPYLFNVVCSDKI